jgi:hypothetical protein
MKLDFSISCCQEPAIVPFPHADEYIPHPSPQLLNIISNILFLAKPKQVLATSQNIFT